MANQNNKTDSINMTINEHMIECKMHGIKRIVETSITGQRLKDDNGEYLYDMAKNEKGDEKKVYRTAFDTINIRVTIDFEGATLQQCIDWLITKSNSITVAIQNKYRPLGKEAVESLDGTTLLFTDLVTDTRVTRTPQSTIMTALNKIKDPVEREKQRLALIEFLSQSQQ